MSVFADRKLPATGDIVLPLPVHAPRLPVRSLPRRICLFLRPSFLSRQPRPHEPDHPTVFLDGLRGYAALIVFINHYVLLTHPNGNIGYGGNHGLDDRWLLQLPIIRLVHSGLASVHVFFVISGFSISLKPIKLARRGSFDGVFRTLVSATFRRACRLYLPCLALLVCTLFLSLMGAFDNVNELVKDWPFGDTPMLVPPVKSTTLAQLSDFTHHIWQWSDPLNRYSHISYMPYSLQLWTIPVELHCSFITFTAILGLSTVRANIRIASLAVLSFYLYFRLHCDPSLFLAGTIFAELYIIRQEIPHQTLSKSDDVHSCSRKHRIIYGLLFTLSLFLLSYPRISDGKAYFYGPFYFLGSLIVGNAGKNLLSFYTSLGSVLIVYSVSQSRWLQHFFSTRLAKYLGKISFAFYCVHMPLINWFGCRNILLMWQITGKATIFQFELGFGIAFLFQFVVSIWLADIFHRAVDVPSVSFAKWLEKKCQ